MSDAAAFLIAGLVCFWLGAPEVVTWPLLGLGIVVALSGLWAEP